MTHLLKSTYRLIFGQEELSIRTAGTHKVRIRQSIAFWSKASGMILTFAMEGLSLLALYDYNVTNLVGSFLSLTMASGTIIWWRTGRLWPTLKSLEEILSSGSTQTKESRAPTGLSFLQSTLHILQSNLKLDHSRIPLKAWIGLRFLQILCLLEFRLRAKIQGFLYSQPRPLLMGRRRNE